MGDELYSKGLTPREREQIKSLWERLEREREVVRTPRRWFIDYFVTILVREIILFPSHFSIMPVQKSGRNYSKYCK